MSILRLSTRALPLLAAVATLGACERGGTGDSAGSEAGSAARAEYSRQMIFVAADATGAALLDFTALDAGSVVRRSARGWAEAGSGWTPLYDLAWEGVTVRRPWRLVPNGPIRLRVGLNDEVEAIFVRDGETDLAALETGDFVAEWAPFATSQIVLREATLALGGEPMTGWLIDARFGVPQAADDSAEELAPDGDAPSPAPGPAPADSGGPASIDSVMNEVIEQYQAGTTALPVRSLRGVLVTAEGETLVIGSTENGLGGWLWTDDAERTLQSLTLTLVAGERESWSLEGDGGTALSGTLTVMDEEPLPLSPRIVRGTLRIGGADLLMHGVLRGGD